MVTSMNLDLNGNAITVSSELYGRMIGSGVKDIDTPQGSARALKSVIDQDKAENRPPLTFAIVYPESSHNYLLRYWMADAGIDPDKDVILRVVPPPQMVHYLRAGMISGYCVGEPWNSYAVTEGVGRTLLTSYDIWNNHPEKVFAVNRQWAEDHPNTHVAVITALLQASRWLDEPANRVETSELLQHGRYVNAPGEVIERSLSGSVLYSAQEPPKALPDFNVFNRYSANYPWRSHALWFLSQMERWGQSLYGYSPREIAQYVYQPEVFKEAARRVGMPYPEDDYKTEGAHTEKWTLKSSAGDIQMGSDQFMDGRQFDANDLDSYCAGFDIRNESASADPEQISGKVG